MNDIIITEGLVKITAQITAQEATPFADPINSKNSVTLNACNVDLISSKQQLDQVSILESTITKETAVRTPSSVKNNNIDQLDTDYSEKAADISLTINKVVSQVIIMSNDE